MSDAVRVLLVDDSPVALAIIERLLSGRLDLTVVGAARSGPEALRLIEELDPDLVCTDYHMPGMDGLALTKEVLAQCPRPVVVMTGSSSRRKEPIEDLVRKAGALELLIKPRLRDAAGDEAVNRFARSLCAMSGVYVFRRKEGTPAAPEPAPRAASPVRMIACGASTGGPHAMGAVLSSLPSSFPVPLLCVQHIGEGFLDGLVRWLGAQTPLRICIAAGGELPQPGHAYFPAEGRHLVVQQDGRLGLSDLPPVDGHRPAITTTFASVARSCHSGCIGVLLTGMGQDGVDGLRAIRHAGGSTIAQSEADCVVYGMPKAAVEQGLVDHVLPLSRIAGKLTELVESHDKRRP